MKSLLFRFFLPIALVAIGGCASSPVKERVGLKESGSEYLSSAAVIVAFDESASGFSIDIPSELARDMTCKGFVDLDGNSVEACRLTFRAFVFDGHGKKFISVYLFQGRGFFFLKDVAAVPSVAILAPDGTEVFVPKSSLTRITEQEARRVMANIAFDMPKYSAPIEGTDNVRVFSGESTQKLVRVPSLVTQTEKNRRCGVYSVSLGEIVGVATANPVAATSSGLWRITQVVCAANAKTQYLREDPSLESKNLHSMSTGDFVPEGER